MKDLIPDESEMKIGIAHPFLLWTLEIEIFFLTDGSSKNKSIYPELSSHSFFILFMTNLNGFLKTVSTFPKTLANFPGTKLFPKDVMIAKCPFLQLSS